MIDTRTLYDRCLNDMRFAIKNMSNELEHPRYDKIMLAHRYFGQSVGVFEAIERSLTVEEIDRWVHMRIEYNVIRHRIDKIMKEVIR